MRAKFCCPDCGHKITYRPAKSEQVVRLQPGGELSRSTEVLAQEAPEKQLLQGQPVQELLATYLIGARYLLVRCTGCGREHDVEERKAGIWWWLASWWCRARTRRGAV